MTFNLTHARHDPAHCLAPGLFRSLRRGDRKKFKLDVQYKFGAERIEFSGPGLLGVDDLRVLQGLVAMAAVSGPGGRGILLHPEPRTESGQHLRRLLDTKFDAITQDAMVVMGSYRQLAKEIGYVDIEDARSIRICLERLSEVSVIVERDGRHMGFRILSTYPNDDADGQLFVALNPRLTEAIKGTSMGSEQYYRIELAEVRALNTDPARLMHQRLHWINAGTTKLVKLDTLCSYIWPEKAMAEAMKKRRQTVRKALDELRAIGWAVHEYATGKFSIARHKLPNFGS